MIDIDTLRAQKNIKGLNECLSHQNWVIRGDAAYALGFLAEKGYFDFNSVSLLNQLLKDSNKSVRGNATSALGNLAMKGICDKESIPLLNQLLNDPDKNVREWAAWALLKVEALAPEEQKKKEIEEQERKHTENQKNEERISRVKKYEYAMNYPKAADLYEELEMWDDARRCRALAAGGNKTEDPTKAGIVRTTYVPPTVMKHDKDIERLLSKIISFDVPEYMDAGTISEILVEFNNTSDKILTDINVDFTEMKEDFEVEGDVTIKTLTPGKSLKMRIKIKSRFDEGVFPVKLRIISGGTQVERNYTIKVGGTEIY